MMDKTTELAAGLSEQEARSRLSANGYNEIREEPASLFRGIVKRLWGPIPWMLEIALALEAAIGKTVEPAIIGAWLLFSAVIGGVQERRAQSALDLLRQRLQVTARVCRDGMWRTLPARELVPGDVVRVQPGDLVPADCTIRAGTLELDQSALTGESAAVRRSEGDTMYSSSTVRSGSGIGVVVATGAGSYFGRTAELLRKTSAPGHLDRLLFAVVRYLVAVDGVLTAILVAFVIWRGEELLPLLPFLLVLVTATVPITMPAAFTVANAVEARTLAGEGVLVTGLSAVQEAGTMDVLCIDKTGTLTRNEERVAAVVPLDGESEAGILALAASACDPAEQSALDRAILEECERRSIPQLARLDYRPFDPAAKRSEAHVEHEGRILRVVLGSPIVVAQPGGAGAGLMARAAELAATGARILAVAAGPDGQLAVKGLVALADPPRDDAPGLIAALRSLGLRILMLSGDTAATARAISARIGLGDRFGSLPEGLEAPLAYDGFAGVFPEDKYHVVQSLQRAGRVVGMTGDGVNDAPALRQAEVGVAVDTASDVAKAAARVVLTVAGLAGIVAVVRAGRRVYRRMLTWTITKIARTIELAALLTIGYIATGILVTPLVLIAIIIVLNDVVTITLATDRAWIAPAPERWNLAEIARIAGGLAAGWLALGLAILWVAWSVLRLPVPEIQTLMFVYLMYSAQATIYLARVGGRFWSFAPSRYVLGATLGNAAVASALAYWGLLTAAVPATHLLAILASVLVAATVFDQMKIRAVRRSGVLGGG